MRRKIPKCDLCGQKGHTKSKCRLYEASRFKKKYGEFELIDIDTYIEYLVLIDPAERERELDHFLGPFTPDATRDMNLYFFWAAKKNGLLSVEEFDSIAETIKSKYDHQQKAILKMLMLRSLEKGRGEKHRKQSRNPLRRRNPDNKFTKLILEIAEYLQTRLLSYQEMNKSRRRKIVRDLVKRNPPLLLDTQQTTIGANLDSIAISLDINDNQEKKWIETGHSNLISFNLLIADDFDAMSDNVYQIASLFVNEAGIELAQAALKHAVLVLNMVPTAKQFMKDLIPLLQHPSFCPNCNSPSLRLEKIIIGGPPSDAAEAGTHSILGDYLCLDCGYAWQIKHHEP